MLELVDAETVVLLIRTFFLLDRQKFYLSA